MIKQIELKKRSYEELQSLCIELVSDNYKLKKWRFDNCRHKTGWCSNIKKCDHCHFAK